MYPLKQSTAITIPFFAHDANGDGVTGIADGSWTKRISKAGGAFAAMTVTITELENGWYSLPVSTAHSDTLGALTVSLAAAACKRVNLQWRVDARVPDDHSFPLTSGQGTSVDGSGRMVLQPTGLDAITSDGKTIFQHVIYAAASAAGKVSGAGSGTETFKGLDGTTTRLTVTVDASGNRTGVTYG